jgi:hypothetical protein
VCVRVSVCVCVCVCVCLCVCLYTCEEGQESASLAGLVPPSSRSIRRRMDSSFSSVVRNYIWVSLSLIHERLCFCSSILPSLLCDVCI